MSNRITAWCVAAPNRELMLYTMAMSEAVAIGKMYDQVLCQKECEEVWWKERLQEGFKVEQLWIERGVKSE